MVKKILKKKVLYTSLMPAALPTVIKYVPAIEMEPGEQYSNIMGTVILTLKQVRPYEGVATGLRAIMGTIVECSGVSQLGETIIVTMNGNNPVMCDVPEILKEIQHSHDVYKGKCADNLVKAKAARPQKVDATGAPIVKKPRGVVDSITGCSAGSQGHVLGLIMIKNKCSPSTRGMCIAEMTACLEKDFGVPTQKSKGLASSWYSTNWIRKPTFYQKKW